jgi:hypothetical protein
VPDPGRNVDTPLGGTMSKREPQIFLKTDERKVIHGLERKEN